MFDFPPYFADGNTEACASQRTRAQPDRINNNSDEYWLRELIITTVMNTG